MRPPRRFIKGDLPTIFVGRKRPVELFDEAVREIPADGVSLLTFYGVGGQGKTALCRHLIKRASAKEYPHFNKIKIAEVDLHGQNKPDPIHLLIWIRNGFAKAQIELPAFDLALAITWEEARAAQAFPKLTNAWLSKSPDLLSEVAPEMVEALPEVAEKMIDSIPGIGPLITRGSKWVFDKSKTSWLHSERPQLKELCNVTGDLKKPHELEALLPWMLAQDLNDHLKIKPWERYVLLIDEYEGVFDRAGAGKRYEDNQFDKAMREIAAETNGLLVVFFSRETLPWVSSDHWQGLLEGRQHQLSGLPDEDATGWLVQVGVNDPETLQAMLEGARQGPGEAIYPLLLELQVEHWRHLITNNLPITAEQFRVNAAAKKDRCEEVVRRVLRNYGPALEFAIERLSVAERFDRLAFKHIIDRFGLALSADVFDQLAQLSLFTATDDGYVSMHRAFADIVSDLIEVVRKTESIESLLSHYEGRLEASSVKELNEENILALFEAAYLMRKFNAEEYVDWLSRNTAQLTQAARATSGEQIWRPALGLCLEIFGEEHPSTASSYNNVASNLNAQGRYEEAEPLFRKAVGLIEKLLGYEHPNSAVMRGNLENFLNKMPKRE